MAYWKANQLERWDGQANQSNLLYNRLPGSAYAPGDAFTVYQPQTLNGTTWFPKFEQISVALFLEDVEVRNAGPSAVVKNAVIKLQEAALNMSERLAISQYRHGQNIAGDNRVLQIHGLSEALSDGVNASWDGNVFPLYGTLARSDMRVNGQPVGKGALDSPLAVTGDVAANINGTITYDILERGYNSVCIGPEKPNLMVTTNLGMSYIKKKFQPQQRFTTASKVAVGFTGLDFNGCEILQSQYCPGTQGQNLGVGNAGVGNFLATAGETLFMLNTKKFTFYIANSEKYAFGFTGWKPAQDNTVIAGQYLYGGPGLVCNMPRFSRQFFGITG